MKYWTHIVRDSDGIVHLTILKSEKDREPKVIRNEPFWGTIQDCVVWCKHNCYDIKKLEDNL